MYIFPLLILYSKAVGAQTQKTGMDIQFADLFEGALGSNDHGDSNFVRAVGGTRCNNKIR